MKGIIDQSMDYLANCDHVIETGEGNNWVWRKWKSGKIEAWGGQAYGAATSTLWVNNTYYRDLTVTLPSGVFTSAPTEIYATCGNLQYWVAGTSNITTSSFTVRLCRPNNASNQAIVRVYAVYWEL